MLHGIPVFAAESSEMIEFDLKTNEMKTVEIEEQNSDSVDSYIPEGISTGIQTYGAIIDGDDRYRIPASLSSTTFPYCSYGVVSCTRPDGTSSFGTGWLLVRTMWQQLRMLYIVKRMVDILLLLFFIPGLITVDQ